MHGITPSNFFVEFCAGSANLSFQVRRAGFRVLAIDHDYNKHSPKVSPICLDTCHKPSQDLILRMLENLRPHSVHMGLPCGTCSRARDRALPANLRSDFRAPPPLRDATHLFGFESLTPTDRKKVDSANELYSFAIRILFVCYTLNSVVSIENPKRSWLWAILTSLVQQSPSADFRVCFANLSRVTFSACMHGSERNKMTTLLATPRVFDELAVECDGTREHAAWHITPMGKSLQFATATEAAYPDLLCNRMATLLRAHAESLNIDLLPIIKTTKQSKQSLGVQATGLHPLIAEFSTFHHCDSPCSTPGYRLLATPLPGDHAELQEKGHKRLRKSYKYGVQWEPAAFFAKVQEVQRPRNPQKVLPDVLKEALVHVLTQDPIQVAKHRLQVVIAIRKKADELKSEEAEMKAKLEPGITAVLKNKHITLWK